jgi:hypothetical protein
VKTGKTAERGLAAARPLPRHCQPCYNGPMATPPEHLIEKIGRLPPDRVAEVEDFVDFISQRDTDRQLARAATAASEPAFAKVWANPEDDAYDQA